MIIQILSSYMQGSLRGGEEAAVALVVGLLMLTWSKIVPDWDWESFRWSELVRFILSQAASFGIFAGVCYGNLDIPGMNPACGTQGIFNAVIVGFLAFLLNEYVEHKVINFIKGLWLRIKKVFTRT